MNGIGRRAVSDRNWKCGQINKVTWRAQLFLLKGESIVDIKSNDDSGRTLKEGTSDWEQKWKCCIEAKNISTNKVQFNVKLSQKSDLWTEGTSDRRRKWSFRIEATEARRTCSGQWTWRRVNAVDTHRHLFSKQAPEKSLGRVCCRALNLEESPQGVDTDICQWNVWLNLISWSLQLDNGS